MSFTALRPYLREVAPLVTTIQISQMVFGLFINASATLVIRICQRWSGGVRTARPSPPLQGAHGSISGRPRSGGDVCTNFCLQVLLQFGGAVSRAGQSPPILHTAIAWACLASMRAAPRGAQVTVTAPGCAQGRGRPPLATAMLGRCEMGLPLLCACIRCNCDASAGSDLQRRPDVLQLFRLGAWSTWHVAPSHVVSIAWRSHALVSSCIFLCTGLSVVSPQHWLPLVLPLALACARCQFSVLFYKSFCVRRAPKFAKSSSGRAKRWTAGNPVEGTCCDCAPRAATNGAQAHGANNGHASGKVVADTPATRPKVD